MKAAITTHNLPADEEGGSEDACAAQEWRQSVIAVLADGVGGSRFGGEAAARTVESVMANMKSRPKSWSAARALAEFSQLTNRTFYDESMARCGRPEILCTLAAVVVEGGQVFGVNAGDSRIYLRQGGHLRQLSRDHVQAGPGLRHVLHRAMGLAAQLEPHSFAVPAGAGDTVLLCSDGVTNVLSDAQIEALLNAGATARTLVLAACQAATPETLDDASAVVIDVTDAGVAGQESLTVPETLRAGDVFDGCELVRPLNVTARTWLARRDGRQLVIKFAPERARGDEAMRDQFAREIWSVTRFEAEFFIRAFVPPDNRAFCYCMEYVPAPTLQEMLQRGPLAVPEAVALAHFLLDAGQYFAARDLVHGDLKPENILAWREGGALRFKLVDFGSVTGVFSVTTRAGTPTFLAPERFHGAPICERTEIFSIGVTLYLALGGRPPYGEIEPFQTPVFHSPLRLTRVNVNIPPWLEAVALRAVAVAPAERYESYSEMKFDLQHPEKVRPWFSRDTPLLERNPLRFYKTGFFVLLLIVLWLLCRLLDRR